MQFKANLKIYVEITKDLSLYNYIINTHLSRKYISDKNYKTIQVTNYPLY